MQNILFQSQPNIGTASLVISLLSFATISIVRAVPQSLQLAQAQQDAELEEQFFLLNY